jgi:ABC-2 type transport system ATP-binding protein
MRLLRLAAVLALACALAPATAAAESYTVRTLNFDTVVGPNDDTRCNIAADLYTPADASEAHRDPAVLTTNGLGGSKNSQAWVGSALASQGYVVLSYSALGQGGSGCGLYLDNPQWDGKAASQLIDFLGGGKAATDGTTIDYVQLDPVAHDGRHYGDDPRVAMIGGSYGGEVQFATASIDPRLDTIIPMITWNDLAYSLFPNNANVASGVTSPTPGVWKWLWTAAIANIGFTDALGSAQPVPSSGVCLGFQPAFCTGLAGSLAGAPTPAFELLLRQDSVSSYISKVRVPALLLQGEHDTLFNLNESAATYEALRDQGVPAKLVWQFWGHSSQTPAPGELDETGDPAAFDASYEGGLIERWLDYYLKGAGTPPPSDFSYFRDWIHYSDDDAAAAYAETDSYPAVPTAQTLYLSGAGELTPSAGDVGPGQSSFVTSPLSLPSSLSEISEFNESVLADPAPEDLAGTVAAYASAPMSTDTNVVGIPTLHVHLSVPLSAAGDAIGANGDVTLFAKLYDAAPDGQVTLPGGRVAPVRLADPNAPVDIQLPALVHQFPAGHRLVLVIAGGDLAYRGSPLPQPVSVIAGGADPSMLSLPVTGLQPGGRRATRPPPAQRSVLLLRRRLVLPPRLRLRLGLGAAGRLERRRGRDRGRVVPRGRR